jgi:hypothetical protein
MIMGTMSRAVKGVVRMPSTARTGRAGWARGPWAGDECYDCPMQTRTRSQSDSVRVRPSPDDDDCGDP